jgi:chorismate mutase
VGKLTKEQVRAKIGLTEAGIISDLLERSTYALNERIYIPGGVPLKIRQERSFFESIFRGKEILFASHGCFRDGREHPFYPESLNVRQVAERDRRKGEDEIPRVVSKNNELMRIYMHMLRSICKPGENEKDFGSCADLDSDALRRLSYRVHYGEVVAEVKLQADPITFGKLIEVGGWQEVRALLRDVGVEKEVTGRVFRKCEALGLDTRMAGIISSFYNIEIIPLTLDVEVEYLKLQQQKILERFSTGQAA